MGQRWGGVGGHNTEEEEEPEETQTLLAVSGGVHSLHTDVYVLE